MLLNRGKESLEASMENALSKVDEIPKIVESFHTSQRDILQGRLESLISSLNGLHGTLFGGTFKEEDFKDAILMTDEHVLSSYASAIGFYPFAVGFIFPSFEPIVAKVLHHPSETRGFYVVKKFFRQRPFSDTGAIFVDRNEIEQTFMHYKGLTSSTQFQYSKTHQLENFNGPKHLRLAYELELALLREIISIYVQNKEFARFQGVSLEPHWNSFWDSLKKEFYSNYLPTYKKMIGQLGATVAEDLEDGLKRKIDSTFDLMKSLSHRDTKDIVNIFFRLGTMPNDMKAGKLYSPLNDIVVYFS